MPEQEANILPLENDSQLVSKQFKAAMWQIILVSMTIFTAYFWLNVPFLEKYSIQAFAASVLLFFIIKKLNKLKFWILPSSTTDEMMVITFAFLILIGSTENLNSIFFPMIYVYIFFTSLCCKVHSAITITLEIMLFHYALHTDLNLYSLSKLVSIPMVMLFFLFTKQQYDEVQKDQQIIELNQQQIKYYQQFVKDQGSAIQKLSQNGQYNVDAESFLADYVGPNLQQLQKLSKQEKNKMILQRQLVLLNFEINNFLKKDQ